MSKFTKIIAKIKKDEGVSCPTCDLLAMKLEHDEDCRGILLALTVMEMLESGEVSIGSPVYEEGYEAARWDGVGGIFKAMGTALIKEAKAKINARTL